jgi:uncharacterized surface protein with fasciclin (FAS1) repeats
MRDRRKLVMIILLLLLTAGLTVSVTAQTQRTVMENIAASGDHTVLASAIKAAGLDGTLNGAGPFTVFAPGNAVFSKIPSGTVSALINDKPKLASLLNYHVVPGKVTYSDLAGMSSIKTVDGKTLPVTKQADGAISVAGVRVLNNGIESKNGIIYPVNSVMTPPGFVMPAAAAAPAAAQGLDLSWLPWLIGALVLGGLGLYLLTRKKHAEPRREAEAYKERVREPEAVYQERSRVAETRRPEETMRDVRESVSSFKAPQIADLAKNLSLPLSGVALTGLNMLIKNGTFKDKTDFLGFLGKTYMQNNMDSTMSGGKEPGTNTIMDIIDKTGIAKGFTGDDTKKFLVPLLMTGFMAVYNYLNKRPEVKVT